MLAGAGVTAGSPSLCLHGSVSRPRRRPSLVPSCSGAHCWPHTCYDCSIAPTSHLTPHLTCNQLRDRPHCLLVSLASIKHCHSLQLFILIITCLVKEKEVSRTETMSIRRALKPVLHKDNSPLERVESFSLLQETSRRLLFVPLESLRAGCL